MFEEQDPDISTERLFAMVCDEATRQLRSRRLIPDGASGFPVGAIDGEST